ncbi:MAG: cardiolipin synthase [Prevotella sp.]|nr:cardiolipin synthase [Prevotella sp.]
MQELYLIGGIISWIVIALTIIHVIMANGQPAKTMAWALVIFFLPLVGIVLYFFFGVNHRRERLVSQHQLDELSKRSMLSFVGQRNLNVSDAYKPMVDLFVNQDLSLPFYTSVMDVMTDGYQFVGQLLKDVAAARHHIHLEMYIIEDDALGNLLADALIERARNGVEVRVIYDDVGCWKVHRRYFERMREEGIEVSPFLPVHFPTFTSKLNYRNHRKVIVIDGRVGYIGGMNIAQRYVQGTGDQPWRDTMLRMQGSIVYGLQRTFLIDWYFVDGTLITGRQYYQGTADTVGGFLAQVVTSAPTSPYPTIMQGYISAITSARSYIYIETPYFLPNEPVLFALKMAAVAGVDVCVICPHRSDARFTEWASRSYLRELSEAGARVCLYEAGFLHSKLMIVDDALATCGSTNVDFRSFENNFESNVFIYDEVVARRLRQVFLADLAQSTLFEDVPSWSRPTFLHRLWESLTRLLSPLL